MGIERFFKQLKNEMYSLKDPAKYIYLVKNIESNAVSFTQTKKGNLIPAETNILDTTSAFYMDYPSIIYNVSAKYRGIINDLIRVLIYRPDTIDAYLTDPLVLSEVAEFIVRKVSDRLVDVKLTLVKINEIVSRPNDEFIINKGR